MHRKGRFRFFFCFYSSSGFFSQNTVQIRTISWQKAIFCLDVTHDSTLLCQVGFEVSRDFPGSQKMGLIFIVLVVWLFSEHFMSIWRHSSQMPCMPSKCNKAFKTVWPLKWVLGAFIPHFSSNRLNRHH